VGVDEWREPLDDGLGLLGRVRRQVRLLGRVVGSVVQFGRFRVDVFDVGPVTVSDADQQVAVVE